MTKTRQPQEEPGPVSRARQLLTVLDETPMAEHQPAALRSHVEQLRTALEDLLGVYDATRLHLWAVWDCSDLIGVFTSREAAQRVRTEHVDQASEYYSELTDTIRESVTITALDVRS